MRTVRPAGEKQPSHITLPVKKNGICTTGVSEYLSDRKFVTLAFDLGDNYVWSAKLFLLLRCIIYFNDFSIFFFIFLKRLNIIRSSQKNVELRRFLRPFRKWAHFTRYPNPEQQKIIFDFWIFFFTFFNRLNITRPSRQKYGQIGNF